MDTANSFEWSGSIADVVNGQCFSGVVVVRRGRIVDIRREGTPGDGPVLIPGLVDAHVHVESSMLPPAEFARAALRWGTVATVSDPHEIANVLGIEGVRYMIEDGERAQLKFAFGAPSCVPATTFETAGAAFGPSDVAELLDDPRVLYLSEVMNFPAVIAGDKQMMAIIHEARRRGKRVDGHAPGVTGSDLHKYVLAGIETDHECSTIDEARERVSLGMRVAIREGSAARNFDALLPILRDAPRACFLCSDDKHPDDLARGHINLLLRRAVEAGVPAMEALKAATCNPVRHYRLPVGLLQLYDAADMVEVDNLQDFIPARVWINGQLVASNGDSKLERHAPRIINRFDGAGCSASSFKVAAAGSRINVIEAVDGQIVTGRSVANARIVDGQVLCDEEHDVLKLVVVNRYERDSTPAVAFVRGFGLRNAALASSVAHDSHNIVAVGTSDELLASAVNAVISTKGGMSCASSQKVASLPLPIAGLMSDLSWQDTARHYEELTQMARSLGCAPAAPFMLLSFLALPVIPSLKLTDKGLFDVDAFSPCSLWA